jgi:hypothetical protein
MPRAKANTKKQKPLAEVSSPLRARAYRAKFRPFESTKYLDVAALKAAKKVTIECGTLEVAGISFQVAAEIQRGMIVALKPLGCEGCTPKGSKKASSAALKKTTAALARKLKQGDISQPALPMPLQISAQRGFDIPIGPIVIVIGGDIWIDVCIQIWIGNKLCWWCLFGPNGCIGFGPPD